MGALFDDMAQRWAVNLSLNSDLVSKPRSSGLNRSGITEAAIQRGVARVAQGRFEVEIQRSVGQHDAHVAEHGTLWEEIKRTLAEEEGEDGSHPG